MSVKFHSFEEVFLGKLKSYLNQHDFADVTLISDDKKSFPANRIILTTGSSFFPKILSGNLGHSHPLMYLKGVRSEVLEPLIQLMYTGNSDIQQHLVDEFIKTVAEMDGLKINVGNSEEQ